jgi:hypothetical protein
MALDNVTADSVADRTEIPVLESSANNDVVTGTKTVGPAGERHARFADLAVL